MSYILYNIYLMVFKCYFFNYLNKSKMLFKMKNTMLIMKIKEKTKIRNQGKISLITTIPKTYVKALNIIQGDKLEWTLNTETENIELKIIKK